MKAPGFWMHETSGRLRFAILAYLHGEPMAEIEITLIRAYLRQWIDADCWGNDPAVQHLRREAAKLTSRSAITSWLDRAFDIGMDPL